MRWVALLAVLAACNGTPPRGPDAGPDAGPPAPDAGPDAGRAALSGYCNSGAGEGCLGPWNCGGFGGAGGFCTADCTADAGVCGTAGSCLAGSNLCVVPCTSVANCTTGQVCASSGGGSFCLPDCRLHSDLCGPHAACNANLGFCTAVGTETIATRCAGSYGQCAAGLTCILAPGAANGFCSQVCDTSANPCPTTPAGAQCDLPVQNGATITYYCGWPCVGADVGTDAGCPTALACADAGSGSFLCE